MLDISVSEKKAWPDLRGKWKQEWQVYGNSEMFINLVKDCLMKALKEYIKIIEITRKTVKSLNE